MATTDELRSRIDKMTQQLQALEGKERSEALKTARDLVKRFAFEPEELGLTSARRVAGKKAPAKRAPFPKVAPRGAAEAAAAADATPSA